MHTTPNKQPVRGALRWPLIIVGLLAAHVGGMVYAVTLIHHRTRSLGVVDDYYGRAVRWDEHQALLRGSRELGWHVTIAPSTEIDPAGQRVITFTLTDAAGKPVTNATLDVTCTHPAHADAPAHATFPASGDGRYSRTLPMRYQGFYDFSVTAKVGDKTFVTTAIQWVDTETVRKS